MISDPSILTPPPVYMGSTITADGGNWQSCGMPFTGNYSRWLRNGAPLSAPVWTPGAPGYHQYVAQFADINASLTFEIEPCNADGCYGSYRGTTNAISPANRAPNNPSNLTPADGTTADSATPTLSATFSDPDGHTGYVAYTVRRFSDNVIVATGNGAWVNSGGTSSWTVPNGLLLPGIVYTWSAQSADALGAGSYPVSAGTYGPNPVWAYPPCSVDGSPESETEACGGAAGMTEPPIAPDTCAGADGFCDATMGELQEAGIDTSEFESTHAIEGAGNPDRLAMGGKAYEAPNGEWTGKLGWYISHLVRNQGNNCAGRVVDNGYCGDLWHVWVQLVNGIPQGGMRATRFFARTGNSNPADKWVRNVGPVPDNWGSSLPSGLYYHHVGWQFGRYQGYWRNSSSLFYPGQFPLDPWNIWPGPNRTGQKRDAFEIHGGNAGHEYEASPTHGCIRIRYQAVPVLRAKWDYKTDNKTYAPRPDLYHYYQP